MLNLIRKFCFRKTDVMPVVVEESSPVQPVSMREIERQIRDEAEEEMYRKQREQKSQSDSGYVPNSAVFPYYGSTSHGHESIHDSHSHSSDCSSSSDGGGGCDGGGGGGGE